MEALGERAWGIFESQWLGTIRRDEGETAAAEVGGSIGRVDRRREEYIHTHAHARAHRPTQNQHTSTTMPPHTLSGRRCA